jgi:hypothetical protein
MGCFGCGGFKPVQIIKGFVNLLTGANEEIFKKRMSICNRYPSRMLTPKKWCMACKCNMPAKTRVKEAECCMGHWGPIIQSDEQNQNTTQEKETTQEAL